MATDRDELYRRRQSRQERERQRWQRQKQLNMRLALAAVVLLLCGLGIFALTKDAHVPTAAPAETDPPTIYDQPSTQPVTTEPTSARERDPITVINIAAAGDLNITDNVIWSGQTSGTFDYTTAFMDVASLFSGADLALLNYEGNFFGTPYGSETFSAPQELAASLKAMGIDLIQMANSNAVANGMDGLVSTLAAIRSAGMEPVGAFASADEFASTKGYTICDINGVKVAFVAFTKGLGGLSLPAGSENRVNLLYTDYATTYQEVNTDGIKKILKNVASEKPDITIALLHWGSEYNDTISTSQKKIAALMQEQGVDVIIGSHPHMVHQIEYDDDTGHLVAYSLGDFYGDGSRGGTNYSIVLNLEITHDADTDTARVTDYSYTPIYILSEDEGYGQRQVVRMTEAIAAYENNFINRVTRTAYDNMVYAKTRIAARVKGE